MIHRTQNLLSNFLCGWTRDCWLKNMKDSNTAIENFETAVIEAVKRIRQWPNKAVQIFHHNDADGLTSGAILSKSFKRAGFSIARCCLEKPYPEILKKVFLDSGRLIIFADFAGRIAPLIAELNAGKNLVIILDHHPAVSSTDPWVINLDAELYGLKGDRDISASTACYRFAIALDSSNADLAWLAVVGSVGDGFGINGRLTGQNRIVAATAQKQGMASLHALADGEEWDLNISTVRPPVQASELAVFLDNLGGVGYYSHGAETGIRLLINGWNNTAVNLARKLVAIKKQIFAHEIRRIEKLGMKRSRRIQWVNVENRFTPMGVKTIGLFCQQLRTLPFTDPDCYILGAMDLPAGVPGFGPMEGSLSKFSMRLPPALEAAVQQGKNPGADTFFPEATTALGGFSDACHSLAAATVLNRGMIETLVEEMERRLSDSF